MIAGFIDGSMAPTDDPFAFSTPWAQILVFLVILIPSLAVAVRRLHDRNKSGWWLLIVLIPIIGPFGFLSIADSYLLKKKAMLLIASGLLLKNHLRNPSFTGRVSIFNIPFNSLSESQFNSCEVFWD